MRDSCRIVPRLGHLGPKDHPASTTTPFYEMNTQQHIPSTKPPCTTMILFSFTQTIHLYLNLIHLIYASFCFLQISLPRQRGSKPSFLPSRHSRRYNSIKKPTHLFSRLPYPLPGNRHHRLYPLSSQSSHPASPSTTSTNNLAR